MFVVLLIGVSTSAERGIEITSTIGEDPEVTHHENWFNKEESIGKIVFTQHDI